MRPAWLARQPGLGLAGIALVVPVGLFLGAAWGGPQSSLLVLGPMSTFGLPVIAMIAFWWEDWPGTVLRPPLSGLVDTLLVVAGGVVSTIAGQAIVAHADLRGVFDPAAPAGHAPAFPATMPLAGAVFVAMLQLTLVSEGWPLRRLDRFLAGGLALAASWAAGVAAYAGLVRTGLLPGAELGAILVCIGAVQVVFYLLLRGWPFGAIAPRAPRLLVANTTTVAGGWLLWLLASTAGLTEATINAAAGTLVAAGLVVGMLFEGWPDSRLTAAVAAVALALLLYLGLEALAHAAGWTVAEPEEWTAYAGLNAIGAGVIMHVAIGRRWPFQARA